MKLFVTGLTGFVGGHLIEELKKENHQVIALVRGPENAERMKSRGITPALGDVTRPGELAGLICGADAVIHLVGIIREPRGVTFQTIHVDGTRNVVEATLAAGVRRYIHMSALGTRPNAVSRYHKSKFEAEEIVRASGLTYTIFRPSVMFGPGDQFINMLKDFFKNPFFVPVIGSGKSKLQPVYVKDVARMFALSPTTKETENRAIEVGGPAEYTYNELMLAIGAHLGKKRILLHAPLQIMRIVAALSERFLSNPPVTRDQITMLQEDNVCDPAPAARMLGVKLTSLEDGLKLYL